MADNESVSSATGSATDDILVVDEEMAMPSDNDFKDIIDNFDKSVTLNPDLDMAPTDNDSLASSAVDKESIGDVSVNSASGGTEDEDPDATPTNATNGKDSGEFFFGTDKIYPTSKDKEQDGAMDHDGTKSKVSKKDSKDSSRGKKKRSPLELLKKLTKFDKPKKQYPSEFNKIRINRLPQVFIVKYVGKKEINGLYGLHHVRKPVDELMSKLKKGVEAKDKMELPLVYMVVSPQGIDIREHSLNKVEGVAPYGKVSIDFISYGVQDIKYWRIFTYIVVKELSSRTKTTELHAVLCDSSLSARKLALSLGGAFRLYSKRLSTEGKSHNFQVELRPPDELAEAYVREECDA